MAFDVAIVGATGAVGELMCRVLEERAFPVRTIKFLASSKSSDRQLEFRGHSHPVQMVGENSFTDVQIVLSSTPASVSREFSPIAASAGAYVIDNSSAWRMDADCPLVVPEVNAEELRNAKRRIVANPNCVAIPFCVALKPLHELGTLRRVVVCTYQSSSGKGARGLADFDAQVRDWSQGKPVTPTTHRGQLVGNVLTLDWSLDANGYTEEENKVVHETRKILGLPGLCVSPTCVRVPVRIAHCLAVVAEFEEPVAVARAKAALAEAPGVKLVDDAPQPIHAAGSDLTFVGRVRQEPGNPNALALWIVADNLRKGAATNAVQCAEELILRGLVK